MGADARGEASIRADIALCIVATLTVLLRLLGRWQSKAQYGIDDCLAIASLIPFYAMCILGGLCTLQIYAPTICTNAHLTFVASTYSVCCRWSRKAIRYSDSDGGQIFLSGMNDTY